jgi:hypothetical protein
MTTYNILPRSDGAGFDAEVLSANSVRHAMLGFAIETDAEAVDRCGQAEKSRWTGGLINLVGTNSRKAPPRRETAITKTVNGCWSSGLAYRPATKPEEPQRQSDRVRSAP